MSLTKKERTSSGRAQESVERSFDIFRHQQFTATFHFHRETGKINCPGSALQWVLSKGAAHRYIEACEEFDMKFIRKREISQEQESAQRRKIISRELQ